MFLKEQLDSILDQKNVIANLLIRDDGSNDATLSILKKYQTLYPNNINLMIGKNVGWRESFMILIKTAQEKFPEVDFYAFSDQDDIWMPTKMYEAVQAIKTLPKGVRLYCSNQTIYRDGSVLGVVRPQTICQTMMGAMLRNYATGCTILFNKELLQIIARGYPPIVMAHDYWCYILANLCGSVYIDSRSFILYRQHSSNSIGARPSFVATWKRRLQSIKKLLGDRNREILARFILDEYEENMSEEGKNTVKKIAQYRKSLSNRIKLLIDKEYTYDLFWNDIWLKFRIIFGRL